MRYAITKLKREENTMYDIQIEKMIEKQVGLQYRFMVALTYNGLSGLCKYNLTDKYTIYRLIDNNIYEGDI